MVEQGTLGYILVDLSPCFWDIYKISWKIIAACAVSCSDVTGYI